MVQLWTQQMPSPHSLTDNLWSNIRWQWWQPFFLGACNRTTTWFHHRSSPRCCGNPVTSHLGNSRNSWFTFCRFSLVKTHSTQNMILICTSKGNTRPNGLFWGSTNPRPSILTVSSLQLTSPLHTTLLILFFPPIPSLRQDLWTRDEKSVPMRGTP